jgi:Type ISP C-terminal specificity domain
LSLSTGRSFLTNSLSGWNDSGDVKLNFPEMREEYDASQAVKRKTRIIVVLGNPPYDGFAGVAQSEEAELVAHYKGVELVTEIDRKTKQTKLDEFGRPKKKQKGESLLYKEYGVRKQLLDDLYIRFLRLAEERIGEKAEYGIVSFISNSSYLTGRSHPLMRQSLLTNFHKVWIDNLNGDKYRTGKLIPQGLPGAGSADQSAFTTELDARGIQPGTAIVTWLKKKGAKTAATESNVHYRDFWGLAGAKRKSLIASLPTGESNHPPESAIPTYQKLSPSRDNRWRLSPHSQEAGYESWASLDELFPIFFQGVEPNRGLEGTVIDTNRSRLMKRVKMYLSASSFAAAAKDYPAFVKKYKRYAPSKVWGETKKIGFGESKIVQSLIFPFDARWIYYETHGKWLNESRPEFAMNLQDNNFLITVPEPRKVSETRPVFAATLVNRHVHERGSAIFPRETRGEGLFSDREANVDEATWRKLREHFGLKGERRDIEARDLVGKLFRLIFAVLHAPVYQFEHASALSADWAHVPVARDQQVFNRLVDVGETIIRLLDTGRDARDVVEVVLGHDRASTVGALRRQDGQHVAPDDLKIDVTYWGGGKGRWKPRAFMEEEKPADEFAVAWGDRTGDLYINDTTFFANIPESVWTYQLGGYPVLKKWLGYRQADRREGEPLNDEERRWFRSVVQRIAALLALSPQLNALYQEASANCFTSDELGISAEAARERRDAKKKKVGGSSKVTPAMKPIKKKPKK